MQTTLKFLIWREYKEGISFYWAEIILSARSDAGQPVQRSGYIVRDFLILSSECGRFYILSFSCHLNRNTKPTTHWSPKIFTAIAFYALMLTEFSSLVRFSCWFRSMGLDGIYQPIRNRMRSINRKPLLKNVKHNGPSQHTPQNHMQGLTRDPRSIRSVWPRASGILATSSPRVVDTWTFHHLLHQLFDRTKSLDQSNNSSKTGLDQHSNHKNHNEILDQTLDLEVERLYGLQADVALPVGVGWSLKR